MQKGFSAVLGVMILLGCSLRASEDWLIHRPVVEAELLVAASGREISLTNGLVTRTFRLTPNAATVGFENLITGESILRGVKPEARVTLNGQEYDVGGLVGQTNYAYLLPEWVDEFRKDDDSFQFERYETGPIQERFSWNRKRYSSAQEWPPKGLHLVLWFRAPDSASDWARGVRVAVHYELYQGIPLLSKWIEILNEGNGPVTLNRFTSEILAAVEYESSVERRGFMFDHPQITPMRTPNLHVESDFIFGAMEPIGGNRVAHWIPDPDYRTQVSYERVTPNLLECRPPLGPDTIIPSGRSFQSFRVFELVFDSTERERNGLARRRMYKHIAPWTTENPIMMHVRNSDPDAVKIAIDQSAEVGFEMVILTFGSGFNMEQTDPEYLAQMKELADYAHSKGIELGGYSLLASRKISPEDDVIHAETGERGNAFFGNSPCLESKWGNEYFDKLYRFFEVTGFDVLEHDGSYPGDACASTTHPGHRGLADSQYLQWKRITDFYRWCRGKGIYLNIPDWYFLNGSSKTAMGYRETNWSLPREQQILHARQNIYDGTWYKSPPMGWMFVPLVEYHGGGEAATLEPLSDHLDAYGKHLSNLFGSGVQAAYRGPRLYDSPETKVLVKQWVDFYKQYRGILDSDLIHIRRADGRDVDAMMHVNPELEQKALLMVWNPLKEEVERELSVPLYYSGLTTFVDVCEQGVECTEYKLDRGYRITLRVTVPAEGQTWFVIQ